MNRLVKVITNKYFLASVAFLVWTLFFDQNDWMTLRQKQQELNTINNNIAYLNAEIGRMDAEKKALLTNPQKLEQYARERYRMKHEGEDVYVVE